MCDNMLPFNIHALIPSGKKDLNIQTNRRGHGHRITILEKALSHQMKNIIRLAQVKNIFAENSKPILKTGGYLVITW